MLERALVDRTDNPAFFQMFSSSEVTPSPLSLGIRPTHLLEERTSGQLVFGQGVAPQAAAE
jgi:hypothetical protein